MSKMITDPGWFVVGLVIGMIGMAFLLKLMNGKKNRRGIDERDG